MTGAIHIQQERPDQPEVVALLDGLDRYLGELYAPEDNHILDVQALRAPDIHFLVARFDGQAVGCGAVRRMADPVQAHAVSFGEIKRMVVDPAQRGRRIGARLLAALEAALVADGVRWARLETGRDQTAALRLYESAGYRPCAAFNGYPDNGLSVFLEKPLT